MRITHVFNETSKNADYMRYDFEHFPKGRSIFHAYATPSHAKIDSYETIKRDYETHEGVHVVNIKGVSTVLQYNDDLRVTGASSHFYSTIASFYAPKTGDTWLVKETHANTYACKL